jgi:hypothetical protein
VADQLMGVARGWRVGRRCRSVHADFHHAN